MLLSLSSVQAQLANFRPSDLTALTVEAAPDYMTTEASTAAGLNTPFNIRHRPEYGGEFSGVTRLVLATNTGSNITCTGSLLAGGMHVLTAAHCVTDAAGKLNVLGGTAYFPVTPTGAFGKGDVMNDKSVTFTNVAAHEGWTGDYKKIGNDLAVISLNGAAPAEAKRYDLYTANDEKGRVTTKVGFGKVGVGATGTTSTWGWRMGQNVWEMDGEQFWAAKDGTVANSGMLFYDFDNGNAKNDAFGRYFGINDLGLGNLEVLAGSGDSGGPTFINGMLAGIVSYGITFSSSGTCSATNPDFLCGLNKSFGEFEADTRVSSYAGWIQAQMVPEPASYMMMLLGLGGLVSLGRRRR